MRINRLWGWLRSAGLAAATLIGRSQVAGAEPAIDISDLRDKLVVLSDGKAHYLAVVPPGQGDAMFYGDGKTFYALSRSSASRNDQDWQRTFVDPRLTEGSGSEGIGFIAYRAGQYRVDCGSRTTPLVAVDAAATQALLAAARFAPSRRQYRPYSLARDDRGIYYYVDRGIQPESAKKFRLFSGAKGNLKQLKMTNIVSDEQGDIFSTKTGSLRLVLNKTESTWIQDEKRSKLTVVKLDFNVQVASIYNDFGVYAGERLGTPCDDL